MTDPTDESPRARGDEGEEGDSNAQERDGRPDEEFSTGEETPRGTGSDEWTGPRQTGEDPVGERARSPPRDDHPVDATHGGQQPREDRPDQDPSAPPRAPENRTGHEELAHGTQPERASSEGEPDHSGDVEAGESAATSTQASQAAQPGQYSQSAQPTDPAQPGQSAQPTQATKPTQSSHPAPVADPDLQTRAGYWRTIAEEEVDYLRGLKPLKGFAAVVVLCCSIGAIGLAPFVEDGLQSAADTIEEEPDALLDNVYLEAVYGQEITPEDVETLHGTLSASSTAADLTAAVVLFGLTVTVLPIMGLYLGIGGTFHNWRTGHLGTLERRGYAGDDAIIGTFLGRCVAAAAIVLAGAVAVVVAAIIQVSVPSTTFVVTALTVVALSFVFLSLGSFAGAIATTRAKAWGIGALALGIVYYQLVTWIPSSQAQLAAMHPWTDASVFLRRFHFGTVLTDTLVMYPIGNAFDLVPTVSLVTETYIDGRSTADAGANELASVPLYLEHWFVYVVIAVWILVPLTLSVVAHRRSFRL